MTEQSDRRRLFPRCRLPRRTWLFALPLMAWIALVVLPVMAQDGQTDDASPAEANDAPEQGAAGGANGASSADDAGQQPDAEQVLQELLQRRQDNPLIEPSRPDDAAESDPANRTTQVGTAPDVPRQTLKREGQFIITRRGQLARPDEGGAAPWMFVFTSDGQAMADPPMLLMPCRQLETMERIAEQRGMDVTFIVSGQVYVYHNRNYLLPTLVKLAPDRGNLEP